MNSLGSIISSLGNGRAIVVLIATISAFAAVLFLARPAAPQMSLLYAGLDDATAGGVIEALDQTGVTYEIRGSSVFVTTADRDRLRMRLARDGLPANSGQGYELLDNLSGFGTTSQMFDAAYWRAKEGELARTMLASPYILAARVHISVTSLHPFQRDQTPSAAVTVTTRDGTLDQAQAEALRYLVASAVPDLAPTDVAVIDGVGGLISRTDTMPAGGDSAEHAQQLRARVERLLMAHVGPGNAVVEVSVETVTETESIVERRFDPDARVAVSTDVRESTASSQDGRTGDVTVASNLPDGDVSGQSGLATNENSESRALTNFEVSETQREILRVPGAIRRMTVAVLVNERVTTSETGERVSTPRSEQELEDLTGLVAAAVGLDLERGDELTIRSMPFEELPVLGTEAVVSEVSEAPFDLMRLIQIVVVALVTIILGLFVVRPILAGPAGPPLLPASGPAPMALDDSLPAGGALFDDAPDDSELEGLSTLPMTPMTADIPMMGGDFGESDDPVERLRGMIEDRREEAIQVLQSWIDEPKQQVEQE